MGYYVSHNGGDLILREDVGYEEVYKALSGKPLPECDCGRRAINEVVPEMGFRLDEQRSFEWEGEKWGCSEDEFFTAIAPFLQDGCYIQFVGEDGANFRILFENGKWKEQNAEIRWE